MWLGETVCFYLFHLHVGGHRSVIMSTANGKVLLSLVKLIRNGTEKVGFMLKFTIMVCTISVQVQCQACLALRNLASDGVSVAQFYAIH